MALNVIKKSKVAAQGMCTGSAVNVKLSHYCIHYSCPIHIIAYSVDWSPHTKVLAVQIFTVCTYQLGLPSLFAHTMYYSLPCHGSWSSRKWTAASWLVLIICDNVIPNKCIHCDTKDKYLCQYWTCTEALGRDWKNWHRQLTRCEPSWKASVSTAYMMHIVYRLIWLRWILDQKCLCKQSELDPHCWKFQQLLPH